RSSVIFASLHRTSIAITAATLTLLLVYKVALLMLRANGSALVRPGRLRACRDFSRNWALTRCRRGCGGSLDPSLSSRRCRRLQKTQPQRMQIRFVAARHSLGEWTAIQDRVHHARESNRVDVMEESHEKPGLSVGHLDPK